MRLLKEDLKSWAYDADLAGLRYSLEMTTRGLQLSVGGYSSTVSWPSHPLAFEGKGEGVT